MAGPDARRTPGASVMSVSLTGRPLRSAGVVLRATCHPRREATSSRRNQAVGLVGREVTRRVGADVLLEAADGCAGQWPEDAVCRPFVIAQATQRFLNLPA